MKHTVILWFLNHKDHPSASKYHTILFEILRVFCHKGTSYQKCSHLLFTAFLFLFDMYELQTIPIFRVYVCFLIQKTLGISKQRAEAGAFIFFLDTIVTKQRMECARAVFNQS